MAKILFTSDLHFGHKNILTYTDRHKVTTHEDHDEWLCNMWNKQVGERDTVYHIGDFAFTRDKKRLEKILRELKGNIVMIRGNHDHTEAWKFYNTVRGITLRDYFSTRINGVKTVMFHFPIEIWDQQHRGSWHLHGHSHGSFQKAEGYLLDVGIDNAYNLYGEHRLFTEKDIVDYMSTRKPSIANDHHNGDRE